MTPAVHRSAPWDRRRPAGPGKPPNEKISFTAGLVSFPAEK